MDSPDPVVVGETLTYRIDVFNSGPSTATAVTLTDTLPVSVNFVSASSTPADICGESGGIVTCNYGNVANSWTTSVVIRVVPTSTGPITNTVSVEASSPSDPNLSNNTATQTTTVVAPSADLRVTKTDSPDPVVVGEILTYRIDVFNNGPSSSTAVTLTDTLPPGVTFVSATSQGPCNELGGIVTCNIGDLDFGAMATSTVIRIRPTSTGPITNTASVEASSPPDLNTSNNTATQTTTVVIPSADLSVTKTDFPDPVLIGDTLTYIINVRNNGPSIATGVTLTDNLPPGVTFVSATSEGPCSELGGTVTCDLGDLGIGAMATSTVIRIIPNEGGLISNTASVEADDPPDLITNNNTATQVTSVITPAADLSLTKTDFPDPVFVGETLIYTIDVRNNGPSVATGVTLTDTLPPGVTFVSATSQGPCSKLGATVTCSIGNLGVGAMATSTVIKIRPNESGLITNTATVTVSDPLDPNPNNNTATQSTAVSPADLSITKRDDPDPVLVGQPLVYTLIVVNNGPATSTAVILTDNLPQSVNFVSATPSQGSCNEVAGLVTCNLGNLDVGSVATTTILVMPAAAGSITNTASVASIGFDPDVTNNSTTVTTIVTPSAGQLSMAIDIKPGSDPNSINPKSRGTIPVAILSTPDFDAPGEVDKASLTFGRTGDEQSLARCAKGPEDVNGDGLLDIVCHFGTQDTGFQAGDTEGILRGETLDGVSIEGRDSVRIVIP